MNATAQGFAALVSDLREPESSAISPGRVASFFKLQAGELANSAGVHRNTLRLHPESARLQAYLRDLLRVLSAASELNPDPAAAAYWVSNVPIAAFRHKTARELVAEGRAQDVVSYLMSLEAGFVG